MQSIRHIYEYIQNIIYHSYINYNNVDTIIQLNVSNIRSIMQSIHHIL